MIVLRYSELPSGKYRLDVISEEAVDEVFLMQLLQDTVINLIENGFSEDEEDRPKLTVIEGGKAKSGGQPLSGA